MSYQIGELIRKQETDFQAGTTTLSKYVDFDLLQNLEKIDAYTNSKHISGDVDSLGREKPFFNIVTSAVNIWYRATDIDRKHIKIRPTKQKDTIKALVATYYLQDWMRREKFGTFLNAWGRTLAKYGSSVVKFVEKDGKLVPMVVDWNTLIIDPIDFENNPVIEVLEYTPAQLRKHKAYDQELVEKLIDAVEARQTRDGFDKDDKDNYIKLYEIHGELPKSYLTDEEDDEKKYVQQMHVVSFVESKEKGEYDDFCLVSGKESKDPYMITHLIKEDGRSQAIGAVEHLFEAQWMVNHTVKEIKDHLDLASKLIFQTSDGNFVGQNALSAIESGDILIHSPNEPLTQFNNSSHDITTLQNYGTQWRQLAQEIVSTPDALIGNTQPSGTAWRQVEALQQEAHSLFEQMIENKGNHIIDMMTDYVIPHIKKRLQNTDELVAVLEDHDVRKIDSRFIKIASTAKTNKQVVDLAIQALESGTPLNPEAQAIIQSENEQELQQKLNENGTTRFFIPSEIESETWDKVFKDMEWDLDVDVTGEGSFYREDLATLTTILQTIGANPAMLQDPNAKMLFNKILNLTGAISPVEIEPMQATPPQPIQPETLQTPQPQLQNNLQQ